MARESGRARRIVSKEKLMSIAAVSSSSIYQELQSFSQQRAADVQQLGKDLTAGNLANAQQDYTTLQTLGQSGPSANGDVFGSSQREQDLNAIGRALKAGNLSDAQQAFAQLQSTYHSNASAASTSTSSSASSIYQQLQAYRQQRSADVQQLGQDLTAGNITNAQQDYNALQALGQSGPSKNGDTFSNSQREQDLNAIGQALQAGDLAGAQQAFAQLESTYVKHQTSPPVSLPPPVTVPPPITVVPPATVHPPASVPPKIVGSSGSSSGTEIILNLANAPAGEQITLGLTNEANGNEQVTISAVNQQNQTPEQITLDVNPNTNQQIILNLFGSPSNSTQGSSLNTTA
jgi:hypothetical protein